MTKKRKAIIVILSLLIALTVGFIWSNSVRSISESSEQSEATFSFVREILDFIFGKGVITHAIFRKLAHFGEFFVLSIEINLLVVVTKKYKITRVYVPMLCGLLVAIVDEVIQIFSHRGPAVVDVLIDFGGVSLATLFVLLIMLIIIKKRNSKSHD